MGVGHVSLPWGWVSKLLSRSAGVGHVFLCNPFFKSSSPPPALFDHFLASWQFDMGDPFHGQLTSVKTKYPLTSITSPYRGLK